MGKYDKGSPKGLSFLLGCWGNAHDLTDRTVQHNILYVILNLLIGRFFGEAAGVYRVQFSTSPIVELCRNIYQGFPIFLPNSDGERRVKLMKLRPLRQWICDTCGEIIQKPEDGYVQFHKDENGHYDDFIIVHHYPASPYKDQSKEGCYRYNSDLDLEIYLGEQGLVQLLALIDPGQHKRKVLDKPYVSNIRKWVELVRRLHVPYYEEARRYWKRAEQDGFFIDANEAWPYLPKHLKMLIEEYGDK